MNDKFFVLGLDGMPYSLMGTDYFKNHMPKLIALFKQAGLHRMNSVYPVISSVAWTSYATGANPGEHGIYGFVDRYYNPFSLMVPTSLDRKKATIWKNLSRDKKVYSINVPLTYPPEQVSGKMVSCFLCPKIEKLTYPSDYYKVLKNMEYIIDVDAFLARTDRIGMLNQLIKAMQIRFRLVFDILKEEEWDFIQLHIMETDRLMHFFFDNIGGVSTNEEQILVDRFFQLLDENIDRLIQKLGDEVKILILSDHGMCHIQTEVQMNIWLEQQGLLHFSKNSDRTIEAYSPDSICYSLTPGRIYINLAGREEKGTVALKDYDMVRENIRKQLLELVHAETGQPVIDKVLFREEYYTGQCLEQAPDIIAHPVNGFDLKASVMEKEVFTHSCLNGMHTYEDAVIAGINMDVSGISSILQVYNLIMGYME
jgi:predicted AlkP superfamily phosphohydrolase/phosphomutase